MRFLISFDFLIFFIFLILSFNIKFLFNFIIRYLIFFFSFDLPSEKGYVRITPIRFNLKLKLKK